MTRAQMLQKIRYENLKQAKVEIKVSFYGSRCGLDRIFGVEEKTSTKNMKCLLKVCGRVGQNNFT